MSKLGWKSTVFSTSPDRNVPEVERPDGLHDEEVGGKRVLRQIVVGQVQDFDTRKRTEPSKD